MTINAYRDGYYAFCFDHNEEAQEALDEYNAESPQSEYILADFSFQIEDDSYPQETFDYTNIENVCEMIAYVEYDDDLVTVWSYLVTDGGYSITTVDTPDIRRVDYQNDFEDAARQIAFEREDVSGNGAPYFDFVAYGESVGLVEYNGLVILNADSL